MCFLSFSLLFAETLEGLEKWQKLAESDAALQKQKQRLHDTLAKEAQRARDDKVNAVKDEEKARQDAEAGEGGDLLKALEEDTDVDERFSFVMKKDRMADVDMDYWMERLRWKIPQVQFMLTACC